MEKETIPTANIVFAVLNDGTTVNKLTEKDAVYALRQQDQDGDDEPVREKKKKKAIRWDYYKNCLNCRSRS